MAIKKEAPSPEEEEVKKWTIKICRDIKKAMAPLKKIDQGVAFIVILNIIHTQVYNFMASTIESCGKKVSASLAQHLLDGIKEQMEHQLDGKNPGTFISLDKPS